MENAIVASGVGAGGVGAGLSADLLQPINTNEAKKKEINPFFILRFLIIFQM
jgi:hypothetical protein